MSPNWAAKTVVRKGGELGWVSPGDTVPEFEAAMTKAALNTVVGPVRTQFGITCSKSLNASQDVTRERTRQSGCRSRCVTVKRMKRSRHGCANSGTARRSRSNKRHLDVHLQRNALQPARRRVTATKRLPDV